MIFIQFLDLSLKGDTTQKSAGPKETIEVEVINLDDFLRKNSISMVDILKFDIQGGESSALRGAESLL